MRSFLPLAVISLLLAATSEANAQGGDLFEIDTDTIYSLVVDSADHPSEDFVFLLDDGIVRFEADGRAHEVYRQVVQILTRDGAERWGEQSFSYLEGREALTIDHVRVIGPAGELISEGPRHQQESLAPTPRQYPIFTDTKVIRFSIGGLEPGTLLDIMWTRETLDPMLEGNYSSSWSVVTGVPTRRSRLVLDVPATLDPHILERGIDFARDTLEHDGRRALIWATQDVPVPEPEPYATWPDNGAMGIAFAAPIEWGTIARWYADLAADRYELTPEIEAALAEELVGAETRGDSLRAVHRWVAQDFRYVSLSLGRAGYQPRPPGEVFEAKAGDCKDKATLFIALLQEIGITAYPVLVHQAALADSALPSLDEFDHMIAAVSRDDGYEFVDLTAETVPYGTLPPSLEEGFALLVRPDGSAEQLRLPATTADDNSNQMRVVGALDAEGAFRGHYVQTGTGIGELMLRGAALSMKGLDERERQQVERVMAQSVFPGASADSVEFFDGLDLAAEARLSFGVEAADLLKPVGDMYIFTIPMDKLDFQGMAREVQAHLPRKYPIDAEEILGPITIVWTLELTVPDDWTVDLPESVSASSRFGSYASTYEMDGSMVRMERRLAGRRGKLPADAVDELIGWLRAMAADDVEYLSLRPPAGEEAGS